MKKILFSTLFLLFSVALHAQTLLSPKTLKAIMPEKEFDNVLVQPIYSDSLSSSFIIWIKKEVKAHYHAYHTEQVYIIEGKARMKLGEQSFVVKAGDWVPIPKNIVHAVEVISKKPLKVLSIQAPHFDGTDRVMY